MGDPTQFSMREVFLLALLVCDFASIVTMLVSISEKDGEFLAALLIASGAVWQHSGPSPPAAAAGDFGSG